MKNPHHSEVANDIMDAVLKARAANGILAIYHPQPKQERHIIEAYNKWQDHGGVWTVAAAKVSQMYLFPV